MCYMFLCHNSHRLFQFVLLAQGKVPTKLALKRYYRPEDISVQYAYEAGLNEVFKSDETLDVEIDDLEGQCSVIQGEHATGMSLLIAAITYTWLYDMYSEMHIRNCLHILT